MANENGIVKEIKDAVNDNEHSIDERAPGTPFALVALSYLGVLAIVCIVFAMFMCLT